jgi:hypothetical protein
MARQSPTYSDFNPTGDDRVRWIKGHVDELIAFIQAGGEASGPKSKRMTAIAVTNFEQGSMWAVKALFSEDAVKGDDGGSGTGEPAARVEDEADLPPASA